MNIMKKTKIGICNKCKENRKISQTVGKYNYCKGCIRNTRSGKKKFINKFTENKLASLDGDFHPYEDDLQYEGDIVV